MAKTGDDDHGDGRPTATSAAILVLVTALAGAALTDVVDLAGPAAVGAAGGTALTAALWAVGRERRRTAGHFVASLLALPIGLGLAAATVGAGLVLVGATFPVANAAALPSAVVDVFARAALVFGVVVGAFGAVTAAAGVLRTERVRWTTAVALRTSLPPFVAATALAGLAVLDFLGSAAASGALLGDAVGLLATALFAPEPTRPHVGSALLLAGLALVALDRAVRALPLAELVTGRELVPGSERTAGDADDEWPASDGRTAGDEWTRGERAGDGLGPRTDDGEGSAGRDGDPGGPEADRSGEYERVLDGFHRWTSRAGVLALALFPVGAVVDLVPADVLRSVLTPGPYELATAVTAAPPLRTLAWWTAVVGAVVYAVARGVRSLSRSPTDRIGTAVAPLAAGALLTGLAAAVAAPVVGAGVDWAVATLPGELGRNVSTAADAAVAFYGPGTILIGVTALLLIVTASAVGFLWLALRTPYLEPDTAAVSLASTGLFQAAAFAAVVGASRALVVAGLAAALLAWDQGTYGLVLGREVGHARSTRRTELAHAAGTLAVGGVGAGVALGLARVGEGLPAAVEGAGAAVLVVVVGLALLIVALR